MKRLLVLVIVVLGVVHGVSSAGGTVIGANTVRTIEAIDGV